MINEVLLSVTEPCGCVSGVYRDVTTGRLTTRGHDVPCASCDEARQADYLAECAAEAASERYYEDRGADDGFDEWEARRGVVQFSDAYAAALEALS